MAPVPPPIHSVQDVPPTGGYPRIPFRYKSNHTRGPPGWIVWSFIIGGYIYGQARLAGHSNQRQLDHQERRYARMAIQPMLETEQDRIKIALIEEKDLREEIIMHDVPGWKSKRGNYAFREFAITF